jgi:hypothetical protein
VARLRMSQALCAAYAQNEGGALLATIDVRTMGVMAPMARSATPLSAWSYGGQESKLMLSRARKALKSALMNSPALSARSAPMRRGAAPGAREPYALNRETYCWKHDRASLLCRIV